MQNLNIVDQNDLISIIIPFYNEEYYFEDCINSVLRQSYKNYEIIIVNDASKMEYQNKLNHYKNLYPKLIKIINNEKNQGVAISRNKGIDVAKGKYIAFLDSDDQWMPYKLEHQYNLIKKNKIDYIHGSYLIVDENKNFQGYLKGKNLRHKDLIKSCDIGLSTVMILAEICKQNKFEKISTKEDYILWLKLSKKQNYLFGDDRIVSIYKSKKNSLSKNLIINFYNAFKVYRNYEKQNILKTLYLILRLSYNRLIKYKKISELSDSNIRDISENFSLNK